MHQDDTYTTQATNDKNEAASVSAANKTKTDKDDTTTTGIATAVNPDDTQPGDPDSQYDQHAKFLLGHKIILAHILAALIEEFHGMEPKDILPYIEGDIHIGRVPIDPGKTNTVLLSDTDASTDTNTDTNSPRIIGLRNENSEPNEGLIYFDILFSLLLPNRQLPDKHQRSRKTAGRLLRAIVDIEAQKDDPTTYKLMNRCIFYVCRLVSSQKERDFVKMHFDDLCRSYSIWICMNAKADYVEYTSLHQTMLLGTCHTKGSLDLINIIVIGLKKEKEEAPTGANMAETNLYRRLHRLLRVLFSTTLSKTEKLDILEQEFGIVQGAYDASMIESLRKETDTMCNLSQAVKELGIEIGKKEGWC